MYSNLFFLSNKSIGKRNNKISVIEIVLCLDFSVLIFEFHYSYSHQNVKEKRSNCANDNNKTISRIYYIYIKDGVVEMIDRQCDFFVFNTNRSNSKKNIHFIYSPQTNENSAFYLFIIITFNLGKYSSYLGFFECSIAINLEI